MTTRCYQCGALMDESLNCPDPSCPASAERRASRKPDAAPYDVPEAKDMLALFKLAAMDGYNRKPVGTVEDWVEECKKRMFLLYMAGRRDGAQRDASDPPAASDEAGLRPKLLEELYALTKTWRCHADYWKTILPVMDKLEATKGNGAVQEVFTAREATTLAEFATRRDSLHGTFNGGHSGKEWEAFHHGMDTVFNCIDAEVAGERRQDVAIRVAARSEAGPNDR